ncbi:hypothetical protein LEMLEM_LOCUS21843 [Lemmus lemmus]
MPSLCSAPSMRSALRDSYVMYS